MQRGKGQGQEAGSRRAGRLHLTLEKKLLSHCSKGIASSPGFRTRWGYVVQPAG